MQNTLGDSGYTLAVKVRIEMGLIILTRLNGFFKKFNEVHNVKGR